MYEICLNSKRRQYIEQIGIENKLLNQPKIN